MNERFKKRKVKVRIEDLNTSKIENQHIEEISKTLTKQIDKEVFRKKYATAATILKIVGTGVFIAGTLAFPTLPIILKPFFINDNEREVWKRFNIPYIKRTLIRLEKQKLVEFIDDGKYQSVEITEAGKRRILRFAIDEITIEKPKIWDGKWRLVSYDILGKSNRVRDIFHNYLRTWGFYPFHKSVFLHAYPCEKQIVFLREYLGISKDVRILRVDKIENDKLYRDFFGV